MVRLRELLAINNIVFVSNFNSYMVRLRELQSFQTDQLHTNFNSYMVRLRELGRLDMFSEYNFNSYMVRLRVAKPLEIIFSATLFQFLHGAIKGAFMVPTTFKLTNFNSYMVRLREFPYHYIAVVIGAISIPTWCD